METKNSERGEGSSSSREDGWEFDVFISFRGEDTRKGFTGHLHAALVDKGIRAFKDNEDLVKGESLDELFGYIERSRLFVIIFSEHYADSIWCLREIAKIVKCGRLIIPVFFDVEPSHVKNQKGPFGSGFKKHLDNQEVRKEINGWINALSTAGAISGYNLRTDTNGDEAKLIELIVEWILDEVDNAPLNVGRYPVGLESRIVDLMQLLKIEADDSKKKKKEIEAGEVRMIGIWGKGGIGKTTLAKAVYNILFSRFDACTFIENVKEEANQANGLIRLQEQLLRHLLKEKETSISSIGGGVEKIQKRLRYKKVLVVIDDVDDKRQIDALAGSRDWFGTGSIIIITSRDKSALLAGGVNEGDIYDLKELNDEESLQLFCWHAFGRSEPTREYTESASSIASIAGGLPLCLEVYGTHFKMGTPEERRNMSKKLDKSST